MSESKPLVSIGVPVYNGEKYLAGALTSLVEQSYPNLAIIISDNASTDRTEAICREFATNDPRIRYLRSETNRGAAWNYNRTFELATGKYFKWAAHDDLCAPTFVEKCVAALEANPAVVLAFTWVIDIDGEGKELGVKRSQTNFDAQQAHERFRGISRIRPTHKCEEVFGVIRTEVLRKTKLIDNYTDSDRTLLTDLTLRGPFYEVPEPLFIHRIHPQNSVHKVKRQERTAWFDTSKAGKIVLPNWRQMGELFGVINRSPLPWSERLQCYWHWLRWIVRRRQRLGRDLTWAVRQMVRV